MSYAAPSISIGEGRLTVILLAGNHAHSLEFEGVLDQEALGAVVGLEILDLRSQLGGAELPPSVPGAVPGWSYDEEVDAFYIHFSASSAPIQTSVSGTAVLDRAGVLLSLEVPLPPSGQ